MAKVDVYIGGYFTIEPRDESQNKRLASTACHVGDSLKIKHDEKTGELIATLANGDEIGVCKPKNRLSIINAIENDWICQFTLALVTYSKKDKSYAGELVYQCYHPDKRKTESQRALGAYVAHTIKQIKTGKRPNVHLTGTEYEAIIESEGASLPEYKEIPLPSGVGVAGSGVVVFKRSASMIDQMTQQAAQGNQGCKIAAYLAILLVVALAGVIIWKLVS